MCAVLLGAVLVLSTVRTLLCMSLLCIVMQRTIQISPLS
ncbi:unnamed protein product, partial [Staurois parvus]